MCVYIYTCTYTNAELCTYLRTYPHEYLYVCMYYGYGFAYYKNII